MPKLIVSLMLVASLAACGGGNGAAPTSTAAPGASGSPTPRIVAPPVIEPAEPGLRPAPPMLPHP